MRPLNSAVSNAAQNYFRQLAGSPDFKDLKPPEGVSHTSGELAPGRPGSDPDARVRMAEDSFQSLVDLDKSAYNPMMVGGVLGALGSDGADFDPRPGKIHRVELASNKWKSPAVTVAEYTGDSSNGYAMSTTTHLGEDGQPMWVSHEAVRIQNGQAQTLTVNVGNQDGSSRPQIVVNVADMNEGSPNIGSPGNGTFQHWSLTGEQLTDLGEPLGFLMR
jgi:hypothetical protein